MSANKPSVPTKVRAWLKSEVTADDLEALRTAGSMVYGEFDAAEARWAQQASDGTDPWTTSAAGQAQLLSFWAAFALQTLGEAFLDADYATDPGTVGFVPQVTYDQVLALLDPVDQWVSRARQARVNSLDYRLDSNLALPVSLPAWVEVEPCPVAHLQAMLAAAEAMKARAEAAMVVIESAAFSRHASDQNRVRQLLEQANTAYEAAVALRGRSSVSDELHERIEARVKEAIEAYFTLGQLVAMPSLIASYGKRQPQVGRPSTGQSLPLPSARGFDQWCITSPNNVKQWKRDRAAVAAIRSLWEYDPDPAATLAIQAEINAALERGDIEYARDGRSQLKGNYFCCPWSAVYRTVNSLDIGGTWLRRNQEFTYDVSAEEMAEGGAFKREILKGNFSPTDRVDYCDPESGGHDDD